jgi:cytochrome P450
MVVVSHPADVKAVFLGSSDLRLARSATSRSMFGRSVTTLDGEEHRRHRRLIMPAFHGDRLAVHAGVIRDVTKRHADGWRDRVRLVDAMFRITGETIFRVIFGVDRIEELDELSRTMDTMFAQVSNPAVYLPFARVDLGRLNAWGRYLRARGTFHRLLSAEIVRAREQLEGRTDVLAHTIREGLERGDPLTDEEIRDEMMSLLLLGHATTSAALGWAFQWILGNGSVHARAISEVRDGAPGEGAPTWPWIEACLLESLRLTPPLALAHRFLSGPTQVGDYELPEGTYVRPAPFLTHRRPDVFPEPMRYDPGRFLENRPGPFEFFPFGGGLRTCLGMSFALFQMKIIAATVLERLDLELEAGPTLDVRRVGLLMTPAHGTPVSVRRRRHPEDDGGMA